MKELHSMRSYEDKKIEKEIIDHLLSFIKQCTRKIIFICNLFWMNHSDLNYKIAFDIGAEKIILNESNKTKHSKIKQVSILAKARTALLPYSEKAAVL